MKRRGYSVLFITENERDNILFGKLSDNGFNIVEANTKNEIHKQIEEKTPQIIILDIDTKEHAGKILDIIREIKDITFVPKIVISKITDIKTKMDILKFGVCDYIDKPYNFDELLLRLNCHLLTSLYTSKVLEENTMLKSSRLVDNITGLYNRKYLMNRLVEEVSRATRKGESLSFAIIQMDNYDDMINIHGEGAINYILQQVSLIIKQLGRLSDIVIKYGKSEFAVLCPITDRGGFDIFLDRLIHKINDSVFEYNGESIKFNINIGAYTLQSSDFNSFEKKISNIITFAEEALERSKKLEESRIAYYE